MQIAFVVYQYVCVWWFVWQGRRVGGGGGEGGLKFVAMYVPVHDEYSGETYNKKKEEIEAHIHKCVLNSEREN